MSSEGIPQRCDENSRYEQVSRVQLIYIGAKARCERHTTPKFKDYGGRGIQFLFTSFEEFYKELGNRPKGKSLERINNDGNYEPGNVCWATPREQAANRRTKRLDQFSTEELRRELRKRSTVTH